MDRGAWEAAVHGVANSRARLSDFTFTFHFHALEKEMATHSSILAWRIPGTGSLVGEAWLAAVYGVAQSRTRLKRLSSSSSSGPRHAMKVIPAPSPLSHPQPCVAGVPAEVPHCEAQTSHYCCSLPKLLTQNL